MELSDKCFTSDSGLSSKVCSLTFFCSTGTVEMYKVMQGLFTGDVVRGVEHVKCG